MVKRRFYFALLLFSTIILSCHKSNENKLSENHYSSASPWTRWWWFASEIKENDVRQNLNWLKNNGFGGVEIAWVYPLNRMIKDTINYTPRQEWLSKQWSEIVAFTLAYADSIGLGCDFTFGTLWPFGDSKVAFNEATMKFDDPNWRQEITASWEYPLKGLVVDHLNPIAFKNYAERMLQSLPKPKTKFSNACFIDSWEVETRALWTHNFDKIFQQQMGYDIKPYMNSLYLPEYSAYYYDYMKVLSKMVVQFYYQFDSILNSVGFLSRGQCSGAPCDLISAYSKLDIPETEALLFEPFFSRIVASAASLSNKPIVSSETFTCLYGWPRDYIKEENIADLKLLADALFANGVNQIIWHGKPFVYNHIDTTPFYASVHVGDSGELAKHIPVFNKYLTEVSKYLRSGRNFSNLAVFLPTEDSWMKAEMPKEKQFKWAWGEYEMRYVKIPDHLQGYNPIWINGDFLKKSSVKYQLLYCGKNVFTGLYINCQYIDYENLKQIYYLAKNGLPVFMKTSPIEPGTIKHQDYKSILVALLELNNVYSNENEFLNIVKPLVKGNKLPEFWCRKLNNEYYFFFAHPLTKTISFPMGYGQSFSNKTIEIPVQINIRNKLINYTLQFLPYQSVLIKIDKKGNILPLDIKYIPPAPIVIPRKITGNEKWLVK